MGKVFAPRTTKRQLGTTVSDYGNFARDYFKQNDDKLLKGAQLAHVKLDEITVRDQVRTKFNDDSLRELSENIRVNGLIQPLVIHREKNKFVLICGERRYRAMRLIDMKEAPCFILENKTPDELMAIQFSENSARENLHYVDKADGIYNYQVTTGASERKIQQALGISKTEVHRSLQIAKLPEKIKAAAKQYSIEKYVLLEWEAQVDSKTKAEIEKNILIGALTKRAQLKKYITRTRVSLLSDEEFDAQNKNDNLTADTDKVGAVAVAKANKKDLTTNDLLKALNSGDQKTQKLLKNLIKEINKNS
ncbi:MAG: ParB/RepB/Spo0J family partition protein [Bacteriovoracaceae bacterium]